MVVLVGNKFGHGIQAAHSVGFDPLKLNVVVIPGVNDHEVLDLAALTIDKQWHVRFIEFMPIGNGIYLAIAVGYLQPTCGNKSVIAGA